jgi:hypothetical protein
MSFSHQCAEETDLVENINGIQCMRKMKTIDLFKISHPDFMEV